MSKQNGECIGVELVNALFYGINKSIGEIMGQGGAVLGRRVSQEIVQFLESRDLINKDMNDSDIVNLFVNVMKLSKDLKIIDDKDFVTFKIVEPTLKDFLNEIMQRNITPYVCPFVGVLCNIYSEIKGIKLTLSKVIPKENEVDLVFKKIGQNPKSVKS